MPPDDEQKQREDARRIAAQALWEDLAMRARALHCPEHVVTPWRVAVSGEAPDRLGLQISGCCGKLQIVVGEMVRSDPRISGPS